MLFFLEMAWEGKSADFKQTGRRSHWWMTQRVETSNTSFMLETHIHTRVHPHAHGHTQRKQKGLVFQTGENQRLRDLVKSLYLFSAIYC